QRVESFVRRPLGPHDLDERHERRRVEEVHTGDAFGRGRRPCDLRDRECGRVAREDDITPACALELGEQLPLGVELLDDGLDDDAETWYRVVRDLRPGDAGEPAPLVVLHGGPGATHDYLLSLADLADGGAVIHYDQLGNGRSTHYPERGADFWTVDLFVRELHNLVDALGIADRHHVLGSSWGGFLGQEYALTHPPGLKSLVLTDTAASVPDFLAEANRLR